MAGTDEYRRYLAAQILAEDKTVSYRVLSRALKVHVNRAKQMLFEFQQFQNGLKPDSVHATYLIYGTKHEDETQINGDGDVEMSSSMPEADLDPLSDPVHTSTLTLVEERDLKEALARYEQVLSIHVYSIGPHPSRDLQLLSDVHGRLGEFVQHMDPVNTSRTYGTIANSKAKKRTQQGRRPITAAPAPVRGTSLKAAPTIPATKAAVKTEAKELKDSSAKAPTSSAGSDKKPTSSAARGGLGGIMQSFAKAAAKGPPKQKAKPTPTAKEEEAPVYAMSDDGDDDDFVAQPKASENGETRKSLKDRQADLRRMMEEEDDEPEEKVDTEAEEEDTPADSPVEEPEEPSQEPEKEKPEPTETVSSSGDGRRRGRRRVMKKKQVVDEEGYFVTVQEAAWESFSEDEAPSSQKPKSATPSSSMGSTKTKKAAAKGQGNIMSFFSKK